MKLFSFRALSLATLALASLALLFPSGAAAQGKVQQFLETKRPAEGERNCTLLGPTLCRALNDKSIISLSAAQTAALFADGVTTTLFESRGYVEMNPVARTLLGSRPAWDRMAPLGALQVVGQMWLAERLKTSRHRWMRKVWWVPLSVGISANSSAAISNATLR